MRNTGKIAVGLGAIFNLLLFFVKLYVGISSNSLAIYCDAINNFGDTFACAIAFGGFLLAEKMTDKKSKRAQSLCTFVISLMIFVTGAYFVYNGIQRIVYPLPISYSINYAIIIAATVFAKLLMGVMYILFNKKCDTPVLKAMIMDSFADCSVTVFALMGLFLVGKLNYAVDGVFAVITGGIITVASMKNVIEQGKYLIDD